MYFEEQKNQNQTTANRYKCYKSFVKASPRADWRHFRVGLVLWADIGIWEIECTSFSRKWCELSGPELVH